MKLGNTRYLLEEKHALTVVYFGGSITEGGEDWGWRALMTKHLREKYSEAEIVEINAAIGGTGTELGVYRCDLDVIAHKPDLVFLEFALNDGMRCDEPRVRMNVESIVRKLLLANPYVDIAMAFTTSKSTREFLDEGNVHAGRRAHEAVRAWYGLPEVIDIATSLEKAVLDEGGDWLRCTRDTVHPNAYGYSFMAAAAAEQVDALLDAPARYEPHTLPAPLCPALRLSAHLCSASPLVNTRAQPDTAPEYAFSKLFLTLCGRFPSTIGANKPGASLTFRFSGASVGMYAMVASDSGDAEYRVDGGAWQSVSTWDRYALDFARASFMPLASGLSEGEHALELRVSETKNERSTGRWVRIGAFGVEA